MNETGFVLQMCNITKRFGEAVVLKNVDFKVAPGEVHGLIGANGAGKSTLMKILNGVYLTYEGEIQLKGEAVKFNSPFDAQKRGICMIHQELDLVTNCTVAANIFLGREMLSGKAFKILDRKNMNEKARALLDDLGFEMKETELVENLSTAQQQLLLVARCVAMNAEIIVMDEPTSSLSDTEVQQLFNVIRELKKSGKAIIYISHYLEEIFEVCDRVSVLRDGEMIDTVKTSECDEQKLVQLMIGQAFDNHHKFFRKESYGDVILKVKGLEDTQGKVNGISFELHRGEIKGIAGVVGAGRTEFAEVLYGVRHRKAGEIEYEGKTLNIKAPGDSVKNGFAFVTENRKVEGLINRNSIASNIAIILYKDCLKGPFIDLKKTSKIVQKMIDFMSIKCSSAKQIATDLSGGNQQKVILGRWLSVMPDVLILDQPTRGIDVGAKGEIYQLINDLAEGGTSIILISDELDELINLSDNIISIKKGEVSKIFNNEKRDVTNEELLHSMVV